MGSGSISENLATALPDAEQAAGIDAAFQLGVVAALHLGLRRAGVADASLGVLGQVDERRSVEPVVGQVGCRGLLGNPCDSLHPLAEIGRQASRLAAGAVDPDVLAGPGSQ